MSLRAQLKFLLPLARNLATWCCLVLPWRPVAAQGDSTCWRGSVSLSPDLSISTATTSDQAISGSGSVVISRKSNKSCGAAANQFAILSTNKYDAKQKEGSAANITRHHVGEIRDEVTLPNGVSGVGTSLQLFSDNSMGLYLQQTYSLSGTQALPFTEIPISIVYGGSLVSRHFSSAPSTVFAAPGIGGNVDYRFSFGWTKPKTADTSSASAVPTPPEKAPPAPAELTLQTWNVIGPTPQRRQSFSNAALTVPTLFPGLSLTVKAAFDYVGTPLKGFKNHYFSLDFGPKLTLSQ